MNPKKTKRKTRFLLKIIIGSVIFFTAVIIFRIFVFDREEEAQKSRKDIFQAPLQQEVDEERIRVTKNNNIASEEFERFSNFAGLHKILVDGRYLWIATDNGLVHYEKNRNEVIKIYTEADGLPHNTIRDLVKYKDKIFLGTQGGLSIFDPQEETFVNYLNREEWAYNTNISEFILEEDSLWMSTFGGIRRYDILENKWYNFGHPDGQLALLEETIYFVEPMVVDNNKVFSMSAQASSAGEIAVSLEDRNCSFDDIEAGEDFVLALCSLNIEGSKIYFKNKESDNWEEIVNLSLSLGQGYYAYESLDLIQDQMFLRQIKADGEIALLQYDFGTQEKTYLDIPAAVLRLASTPLAGDNNLFWFGTLDNLYFYNLQEDELFSFVKTQEFPTIFYGLIAQKEDWVLTNTNLGVGLLNFKKAEWKPITTERKGEVYGIWQGNDIWFIGYNSDETIYNIDLVYYNVESEEQKTWELEGNQDLATRLIGKQDNRLLFGQDDKIISYNPASKVKKSVSQFPQEESLFIFTKPFYRTRSYFGYGKLDSNQGGLASLDLEGEEYSILDLPPAFNLAPSGGVIPAGSQIYFAPQDYQEKGLYVYNLDTGEVKNINTDNSQIQQNGATLFDYKNDLLALKVKGEISVGRLGRSVDFFFEKYYEVGLQIYDLVANQWYFFTTEQGLIDNEFEDVLIGEEYIYILGGGVTVYRK